MDHDKCMNGELRNAASSRMFKKAQTPSAKGVRDLQMQEKCRGFALRGSQSEESKGQSLNLSTFSDFPSQSLVGGNCTFPNSQP